MHVQYCVFCFIFVANVLLVTSGEKKYNALTNKLEDWVKDSEVIDLFYETHHQLFKYENHPKALLGSTGAFINNKMVICGGSDGHPGFGGTCKKECYIIEQESSSFHVDMIQKRAYAASVVIADNLWILGGYDNFVMEPQRTSEYISTIDGITWPGPNLPISLYNQAVVDINQSCIMLIGGFDGDASDKTFYFSHMTKLWTIGPNLLQARFAHSAGVITDNTTQEVHIVAVGGKTCIIENTFDCFLNTVEILNEESQWILGKMVYEIGKK